MNAEISIIIPFYNRLELLEKTIKSVLFQDSNDWELILVDDGSDDDTTELQNAYASDNITFSKRVAGPKGAPTCRNIGAGLAKGKYLLFLDSDDLLANWSIEKRKAAIQENPKAELYIFEGLEFDNDTPDQHRLRTIYKCDDPLHQFLSFQSVWQTSCVVWSRELFEKIGGWDESAGSWQDGEIHIRALLEKPNIVWGNAIPDVFIRKHSGKERISNQITIQKLNNRFQTYKRVLKHLEENSEHRATFQKNVNNALFTEVEGYDAPMLKQYAEWIRKELPQNSLRLSLLWYVWIYSMFGRTPLLKRVLFQLRKLGVPNRRLPHWTIRPILSVQLEQELSTKTSKSQHLINEIQYLHGLKKT